MIDLIRKAIRDIEILNNLQFGNETWNRLKQLNREIVARVRECEKEWKAAKPANPFMYFSDDELETLEFELNESINQYSHWEMKEPDNLRHLYSQVVEMMAHRENVKVEADNGIS